MSYIKIKNIKTHYTIMGEKGLDVVLLPGWKQNTEMMQFIQKFLSLQFKVYSLDWPGFGESDLMEEAYSTEDYTEFLKEFIETLGIKNPILIGHSFGCRIAIRYNANGNDVYKMVLTGAAGLKPKRGIEYYAKVYSYKAGKKIFNLPGIKKYKNKVIEKAGSEDYKNSSGVMRDTFVKVVNEDVENLLNKVTAETLLVFGNLDDATPLWMAKVMEEKIPNAGLAIFENQGHYAYYYEHDRFNLVLEAFLKGDYYAK
jgi:pimeloyl-ACP methyl ester carboxylesterase